MDYFVDGPSLTRRDRPSSSFSRCLHTVCLNLVKACERWELRARSSMLLFTCQKEGVSLKLVAAEFPRFLAHGAQPSSRPRGSHSRVRPQSGSPPPSIPTNPRICVGLPKMRFTLGVTRDSTGTGPLACQEHHWIDSSSRGLDKSDRHLVALLYVPLQQTCRRTRVVFMLSGHHGPGWRPYLIYDSSISVWLLRG